MYRRDLLVCQPSPTWYSPPLGTPGQLAEALAEGQECGSQSYLSGKDVPKDQGHGSIVYIYITALHGFFKTEL